MSNTKEDGRKNISILPLSGFFREIIAREKLANPI
jgi:hypothetical protein